MRRFEAIVRSVIPSGALLSRQGALMRPLEAFDVILRAPYPELRNLPPNRLRVRVGVGNRIVLNEVAFLYQPVNFWLHVFASGLADMTSNITDLGCGCGRYALPLRNFGVFGDRFRGSYVGVDVDEEMIAWCRENFDRERFTFYRVDAHSSLYNPRGAGGGGARAIVAAAATQDFVFATSLLTHLLERELRAQLDEAYRILRPGRWTYMSVFCIDDFAGRLGGRWRFGHRVGAAHVENPRWPEAAVAYERSYLENVAADAGFVDVELVPGRTQSLLRMRKP